MTAKTINRLGLHAGVMLISALISLYVVYSSDLINKDGILYISVASAFLTDGLAGAYESFSWPLFGILIALVHGATGLGLENSAYVLNAALLMVMCSAFVLVYEDIAGSGSRAWVAAALVLSLPVVNDYRALLVRDFGFWAFMMVALHFFIHYCRSPCFVSAVKWQLSILIAILFRIEGVAFLAFAPLYLFFRGEGFWRSVSQFVQLNSVLLVLAGVGLLVSGLMGGLSMLSETPTFGYWLSYASPGAIFGSINSEAAVMLGRMQYLSSLGEARLILVSGLLVLVMVKVAQNTGLLFLTVWGYGWHRKWFALAHESRIVVWFAFIGLLTLFALAGNRFFLSSRYTVPTVLFLSLVSFQYVDWMLLRLSRLQNRKWHVLGWLVILVMFLDGVISGGVSKENIRVAGDWAREQIPLGTRAACNEPRLAYYSDGSCEWVDQAETDGGRYLRQLKLERYDYVLLWVGRKDQALQSAIENETALRIVREFQNSKGDRAVVYRLEGSDAMQETGD